MKLMNKPPLGIVPRQIWEEQRKEDIRLALLRTLENSGSNWNIPIEWVEEYNSLAKESKKQRDWDFELLKKFKESQINYSAHRMDKIGTINGHAIKPEKLSNWVNN